MIGALLTALAAAPASWGQTTWYVDDDAPLGGNGASWTTAFKYFQDALALGEDGDEIRVAAGVYKPDQDEAGNVTPGDREATFELVSGVGHYGGYAGLGADDPDQRDVAQFETVLSGDLNGDDGPDFANYEENTLHVVMGGLLGSGTVLDGFAVTSGSASGRTLNDAGAGVYLAAGDPSIIDCTFRHNLANWGAAAYADGSPTLVRCTFAENEAYSGGGAIVVDHGHVTLIDCVFTSNVAYSPSFGGGAINAQAGATDAVNCVFVGNSAACSGGAIYSLVSPTTLFGCVFSGNVAGEGGAMWVHYSNVTVTNCVFSGNSALENYGGIRVNRLQTDVVNSVLWNNCDAGGTGESAQLVQTGEDGSISVSYSCIQNYTGTYGETGVITDDPSFTDADGADDVVGTPDDDLCLTPGSPCVDAADNGAVPWDLDDLDGDGVIVEPIPLDLAGNPRFLDDPNTPDTGAGMPPIIDMGAFELLVPGLVTSVQTLSVPEGGTAMFTVSLAMAPEEPVTVTVTPISGDPDITVQSGASLEFDASNFDLPQSVTLAAALDGDNVNGETTLEVAAWGFVPVNVIASEADAEAEAVVLLVNAAAAPGGDGASWDTAYDDLQDALEASDAVAGSVEIWVAAGTYTPDRGTGDCGASFELRDYVGLFGGFAGGEVELGQRDLLASPTVLSGDLGGGQHSEHVVTAIDVEDSAVLDGFTIRDGWAQGVHTVGYGGGVFISAGSPVIRNCTFADNEAYLGGAVHNEFFGDPVLVACTFVQNTGYSRGGAVYSGFAGIALVDCLFLENLSEEEAAVGCTEGECWLTNCQFLGNAGTNEGGTLRVTRCETCAMNCVFSGNDGPSAAYVDGGWGSLVNCDFSHNYERGIIIEDEADVCLHNCVLWGNSHQGNTDEDAQIHLADEDAQLDIRYSCVQGWTGQLGGIGNHGDDPLFADADGDDDLAGTLDDDLHLVAGSPCIDVGSNWLVLPDHADLDGDGDTDEATPLDLDSEDRFVDDPSTPDGGGGVIAIVDMGAYEFGDTGRGYCRGDLTGDNQRDLDDLIVLLGYYGIVEGAQPCEGDIDSDGDVDLADLAWLLGEYGETCE